MNTTTYPNHPDSSILKLLPPPPSKRRIVIHRFQFIALGVMLSGFLCFAWPARLDIIKGSSKIGVVDKNAIHVHFTDSLIIRNDSGTGPCADTGHCWPPESIVAAGGAALNTTNADNTSNWSITSSDDANYSSARNPTSVWRKTKANEYLLGANSRLSKVHDIFLQLPYSLVEGKTYTLSINSNTNTDDQSETFTYNCYKTISEAIHVSLTGYGRNDPKFADLYMWLGSGGGRDFSFVEGAKIQLYNVSTQEVTTVGTVGPKYKSSGKEVYVCNDWSYWKDFNFTMADVWTVDFSSFTGTGTYQLGVEGVGAGQEFTIASTGVFFKAAKNSLRGLFYQRLGNDDPNVTPKNRKPYFIPGVAGFKVYVTSMHPWHPNWGGATFENEPWDEPNYEAPSSSAWWPYVVDTIKTTSLLARGGHSDAMDWDRNHNNITIGLDLMFAYILSGGKLSDDNDGITESGNGMSDFVDEAKWCVDFWIKAMRPPKGGYSSGMTCPSGDQSHINEATQVMFMTAATAYPGWNAAAQAAMLAECYRIMGKNTLMNEYRDSAISAYNWANSQSDKQLDKDVGHAVRTHKGADLKATAEAYLYNLTGTTTWESAMNSYMSSKITSATSRIEYDQNYNLVYAAAAYAKTNRTVNHPVLHSNIISGAISTAKSEYYSQSTIRQTRRTTGGNVSQFFASQTLLPMLAHALATGADADKLLQCLHYEAGFHLGRNPHNMVLQTAELGPGRDFSGIRVIEAAYTGGLNDGVPGVHPGHTPYGSWWSVDHHDLHKGFYPSGEANWPYSDYWIANTWKVCSMGETTPRETMTDRTALMGYLRSLDGHGGPSATISQKTFDNSMKAKPEIIQRMCGDVLTLSTFGGEHMAIKILKLDGRTVLATHRLASPATISLKGLSVGTYICRIRTDEGVYHHRVTVR